MPTLAYAATLNNYTEEDVAVLRTPNSKLNYIIVGHEVGANGTPHLQIYFQLAKQTKFETIKNWNSTYGRMHFEGANGSDENNYRYCRKLDTEEPNAVWFEIGERKKMGKKGQRNDLESVKKSIDDGMTYDEICETNFEVASRCHRFIKERVQARDSNKQSADLKKQFATSLLRPWQNALLDVCMEVPDSRRIHWMWETEGNVGKSWMARYLGAMHGATILTSGKKVDMVYIYAQKPTKIVLFDLSRTTEATEERKHILDGIYSMAEDLKNGRVVSTKYESKTVFFEVPHVIFFGTLSRITRSGRMTVTL